jgi:demethylmenaquinone methyltransferase / 2-methoxy-6-polyprenyl-1,4-benzoquinol methylase
MFDRIARRYDLLNTLLSGGSDARWRRSAAAETRLRRGGAALDVACGSGRLTRELARRSGPGLVAGLDFSAEMLRVAAHDRPGLSFVRGDALRLPFADGSFEAVTIAFGLRNLADPVEGMREMLRVLVPGGRAVVLEFVKPRPGPVGGAYRLYLKHGLPRIGGVISGQPQAYRYLSDTVDSYRTPAELRGLAERAGWSEVSFRSLTLGTVGILAGNRE